MRTLRLLSASLLLTGLAVVAPVLDLRVAPHPVSPSIDRVLMPVPAAAAEPSTPDEEDGTAGTDPTPQPEASASASPSPATSPSQESTPSASPEPSAQPLESVVTRDTDGTDVVGVTFPDRSSADSVLVTVRTKQDGRWGRWVEADLTDAGPDPGTEEYRRASLATEPVVVAGSDEVQVRVRPRDRGVALGRMEATFVDGGDSRADADIESVPAASANADSVMPPIVTRAGWGADESIRTCDPGYSTSIKGAVVHHTVNANTYSRSEAPGLIRGIYAYHARTLDWCDIGYNFLVDRFGTIYEGRWGGMDRNVIGAQTQGFNAQTTGIASLGTHASSVTGAVDPAWVVRKAIGQVAGWKAWLGGWDPLGSVSYTSAGNPGYPAGQVVTRRTIAGHGELYPTACPGDLMMGRLYSVRSVASGTYQAALESQAVDPALGTETYSRPADGTFDLSGRGYGHGRGMSQWGAYGGALSGLTSRQILEFYYPGTSIGTTLGNADIRVRLSGIPTGATEVRFTRGAQISTSGRTGSLYARNADGSVRYKWRLVPDGTGTTLQWYESGQWRSTSSWRRMTTPVEFTNFRSDLVRVVDSDGAVREYRDTLVMTRSGSGIQTVSRLPLDEYLWSVVPSEMPPSWPAAALETQAVAARTYAVYQKSRQASGSTSDTCDTTSCQVYRGVARYSGGTRTGYEVAASTAAVNRTTRTGVTVDGAPALTEFSASNGGQTVASSLSYQVSKADPYDGKASGSPSRWTSTLPASTVERAYPAVGTVRALRVDERDGVSAWGGRTLEVTVIGSAGSTTVSAAAFRTATGLRSTWWTVTSAPAVSTTGFPKDLSGDGRGDMVAIDAGGSLQLVRGDGAGGFSPTPVSAGWGGRDLVTTIGAWDADSRHDLVARDGGSLYYHPGDGAEGLLPRQLISSGWEAVDWIGGSGDMDGDGHTDFLARSATYGQLKIYRGDGAGRVIGTTLIGKGWNDYREIVSPGDLTGDDRPDVLAVRASDDALLLFRNTGSGKLAAPVPVPGVAPGKFGNMVGPGDVTGDGRSDLVARRLSDSALVLFTGDDTGQLTQTSTITGWWNWKDWSRWS